MELENYHTLTNRIFTPRKLILHKSKCRWRTQCDKKKSGYLVGIAETIYIPNLQDKQLQNKKSGALEMHAAIVKVVSDAKAGKCHRQTIDTYFGLVGHRIRMVVHSPPSLRKS